MTMGFDRYQLKGARRLGVSLHSKRRMFEFHRRADTLRRVIPNVVDVAVPNSDCSSLLAFVSIRQTRTGEARHAIAATLGNDHYVKGVVVVDEDVDVHDEKVVFWAIATSCRFDRDVLTVAESLGTMLNPVASDAGLTSKIAIDATKPYGARFAQTLVIEPESKRRAKEIVGRLLDRS
jgi:4-hydroxy-3-polyprenylbenzoate decarboxylase